MFSKRQQGEAHYWFGLGSVMVAKQILHSQQVDYQDLLDTHLLPFGEGLFWIFHHENSTIHVANSTLVWCLQNGVHVMDWPANSPDLNPMDNLWAILCRSIYADGKQYTNITELKAAIILFSTWENIELSTLQKLVGSMYDRTLKVVLKQDSFIGYFATLVLC